MCAICQKNMNRGNIKRVIPCKHLFHANCAEGLTAETRCPLCRGSVNSMEEVTRKKYKPHNEQDRKRIIEYASKGSDWTELATSLGIKYQTAYTWITKNRGYLAKRGGRKPRVLNDQEINLIMSWVESNPTISLQQIKQKVYAEFRKWISISTISNTLHGQLYSVKCCHAEPANMNNHLNKEKRAEYVRALIEYVRNGKQIVFIDETNFNLFCRKKQGWSRVGSRAVIVTPSSRGPNVHLIGAIGNNGIIKMDKRRGSFKSADANEWISSVLTQWEAMGNQLSELVVVCDNAPCHSKFEEIFLHSPATLLRLGPYSPQLNPIENIWSKIKSFVKSQMEVPNVNPPNMGEQRLQYLETLVEQAKGTISVGDCTRAVMHSTTFHQMALNLEDMPVGT